MRVLFLNIDGVLNSEVTFKKQHFKQGEWRKKKPTRGSELERKYVRQLRRIVRKTSCKIVLSSPWRGTERKTKNSPLHKLLAEYGMGIYDYTGPTLGCRGYEIQEWLDRHSDVTNIVILDDDDDMLHLGKYLVKTKFNNCNYQKWGRFALGLGEGLTKKKASEAIKMLKKKEYINIYAIKDKRNFRKHF